MPIANNIFGSAILAPLVTILAAISLSTLQRCFDWVSVIAETPQRGYLRQIKPYMKTLNTIIDRVFGGNKFTVTTTHILLMGIMILLLCLILENAEKPKRVVVKKATKDNKDD